MGCSGGTLAGANPRLGLLLGLFRQSNRGPPPHALHGSWARPAVRLFQVQLYGPEAAAQADCGISFLVCFLAARGSPPMLRQELQGVHKNVREDNLELIEGGRESGKSGKSGKMRVGVEKNMRFCAS